MRRQDALGVFARGAAAAFLLQSIGLVAAWGVQLALARMLPRSSFGVYFLVTALTTTLAVPGTLGLPVAMMRFLPEYQADGDWRRYAGLLRRSCGLVLGASLGVAGLAAALICLFPASRSPEGRAALLLGIGLIPLLALSSLLVQILRAGDRVVQAVWPPALLQPALMLAGLAALVATGQHPGSLGAVGLLLLSTLAALGAQALLVTRRFRQIVGSRKIASEIVSEHETRRWLQISFPLLLTAGFQMLLAQMDVLTVSALRPAHEIAVYGAAAKLSRFILLTMPAVYLALGPSVSAAHWRGDTPAVQRAVTAAARWTFWPSCAAAIALCVFGKFVLSAYGPGYMGAYVPLCILSLGFLLNAGAGPSMVLLNMTGHQAEVSRISGWTAVGGIAASLALTWTLGLAGAALASALAMIVWNVWLSERAGKHLGVSPFIWKNTSLARK